MKVVITHLSAPWPQGADVGSIVDLPGDEVPGWAVGKCKPAEEGAEATHVWEPAVPPMPFTVAAPAPAALTAEQADKLAELQALLDAERQASGELKSMLEAEQAKTAALTAELAELKAKKKG